MKKLSNYLKYFLKALTGNNLNAAYEITNSDIELDADSTDQKNTQIVS